MIFFIHLSIYFDSFIKKFLSASLFLYCVYVWSQLQQIIFYCMIYLKYLVIVLLIFTISTQTITPTMLLPTYTTKGVDTDYAIGFTTDMAIDSEAYVKVSFPFEFDPRDLTYFTKCLYTNSLLKQLINIPCVLNSRSFIVNLGTIQSNVEHTIIFKNIKNPASSDMSSYFSIATLFKTVHVIENLEFGKTAFTNTPIATQTGQMNNFANTLVDQGSTWTFSFSLSQTYPANYTLRFIFPQGFTSEKVQCNISGIYDTALKTRVFPQKNIYDCLNIKDPLTTSQEVIVSGIVNPNYQMVAANVKVFVVQPNNVVSIEEVSITNSILIQRKNMSVAAKIPNQFRNNSITYIFQINMDSDFYYGDYIKMHFTGLWTFFIEDCTIIEGIQSSGNQKAFFQPLYNKTSSFSDLYIKNFSKISRGRQIAFYVSLRTPLLAGSYSLQITSLRQHGGLVEEYIMPLPINATTGYIKQMRLHPMRQAIKLPVGQTGPIQITLGLRTNLPKTNVLTWGKIVIKITPNLPLPPVNINGVPKCYFYGDIPAVNCTYDDSDPDFTLVTSYTPLDFNFQSSQIPFMITTEGFITEDDQGYTIDALVKRYHFHVQFYTQDSPNIPTQVIFTDWIADPIPLEDFDCDTTVAQFTTQDHLKCTIISPNIDLAANGHIHFFRIQFLGNAYTSNLGKAGNQIYPDYPCLMYGPNLIADPYIKCDLITFLSGPYRSDSLTAYINIYGFSTLPANSQLTIQIPMILRNNWYYTPQYQFGIFEDTWGYNDPDIILYSKTISKEQNLYSSGYSYTSITVTSVLTNSIVNKITNITIRNLGISTSGVDKVIFQVDQTQFEDIGRGHDIQCGEHLCSKFNSPIQYFILYPTRTLTTSQNFTFPFIVTPKYADDYTFKMRLYKSKYYIHHYSFPITITPEPIVTKLFKFDPLLETQTVLYPNKNHYHQVTFTTVNPLPQQTASVKLTFSSQLGLAADYCQVSISPQVLSYDGRGIQCEVNLGQNSVTITNMKEIPAGTIFAIVNRFMSTRTSSTISPTVTIQTFYKSGKLVDKVANVAHFSNPITNTNLKTFSTFSIDNPQIINAPPKKGYFGDLIFNFDPALSSSVTNGYYIIIRLTSEFYVYGNVTGLPLNCQINSIRQQCSYTLNPMTVTFINVPGNFSAGSNTINITTQYQQHNGIYYPANQGRYQVEIQIQNSVGTRLQIVNSYFDIQTGEVTYFVIDYAHKDTGQQNIFQVQFMNGPTTIPAYNHNINAGRIYIGFPTRNSGNINVFSQDLGIGSLGSIVPCYFPTGMNYATPLFGKNLECRLHTSPYIPKNVYVQVINFDTIPPLAIMKIIMAKIINPSNKMVDIDFQLKINTIDPTTKSQAPLYLHSYNLFIDMLNPSISNINEPDSTTLMFEPGAKVGDLNKYVNQTPWSNSNFSQYDWYICEMNSQFQFQGSINGCLPSFYKYCIIYPSINWMAVKIESSNGTLSQLLPKITKLPESISRTNTFYKAYTFKNRRHSETITYTITAANRWMQLRGSMTGFKFEILGVQNKLNINQKKVQVLVSFNVTHKISRYGTIQIQFPNNSTLVPKIYTQCRSAVTLGSTLYGDPTGKPSTNIQGQIGCVVQNTYSWIITAFNQVSAGSQIKVLGLIDLPTILTTSLGTGYIVSYATTHATNTFAYGRTIDYLSTNFPINVENKTWNLDPEVTLYKVEPLRINFKGELNFKIKLPSILYNINSGGYIQLALWKYSTMGFSGGFQGSTGQLICRLKTDTSDYPCQVTSYITSNTYYYLYQLQSSYWNIPANTLLYLTLTTQKGDNNEGIDYPSAVGEYKIQFQAKYSSGDNTQLSTVVYAQVYGPQFNTLNIYSTVNIPDQPNMILVQFVPSSTINANQQFVIEIPTVSNDGVDLFAEDLGMGYLDYSNLIFDLYESSISSMSCKVYTGDKANYQPVKIVCSNFNANIGTGSIVKFGFWVKNPSTTRGLSIALQVYSFDTYTARKFCWNLLQSAIIILPTSVSPTADNGNFYTSSTYRQISGLNFQFTARNARTMNQNDLYILKFNFDLRVQQKQAGKFQYNSGFMHSSDAIFMRNCKTIILRIGANPLGILASGSTTKNVQLTGIFYNPYIKLTDAQSIISAYAFYPFSRQTEKIIHNDKFPSLVPRQLLSPQFQMISIHGNTYSGSLEDYRFQFTMQTSSSATDLVLVKKISIKLPPYATNDFRIVGTECISPSDSVIQVLFCEIDPVTYTIWITPLQKSYTNGDKLIVQSRGLAFKNPINNLNVNKRSFQIKLYTWYDGDNPAIFSSSDDYVFMKQDNTYLPNENALVISGTYYDPHSYLEIPDRVYENQFEPSTTFSSPKTKTPLEFKFKAMTTFNDLSSTSNYHTIKLNFGTYYTYDSQFFTNDMRRDFPTCHLNGLRIQSCYISGGKIIMQFQQKVTSGQEAAVRFSILDPIDQQHDGFYLSNTNVGTITLPIQFFAYGGSSYYYQVQPFHPCFTPETGGVYPSTGIYEASIISGTQVVGMINYLEFTLKFSRTDYNGLVLEIPLLYPDGTKIYNDPKLLNLPSGSEYPCSVGINVDVFCFYQQGSTTGYGRPTRIYITKFTPVATLSFRMLFTNPDVVGVFPSFTFKAFGGSYSPPQIMGNELMGRHTIVDPFKTYPTAGNYTTGTCQFYPSRTLYSKQTYYDFDVKRSQSRDTYIIVEWNLHDPNYGEVCNYDVESSWINDYFIISYSLTDRRLYMVKKLLSDYIMNTAYHRFGYLRQKHFRDNSYKVYLLEKPTFHDLTCTVGWSWVSTYRSSSTIGDISIDRMDVANKKTGTTSWMYMSLNLNNVTTLSNSYFDPSDPADMVLYVKFVNNAPHSSFYSSTHCNIESGLTSLDLLKPVTCEISTGTNQIIFRNFNKFTNQYLRFYYYATSTIANQGNTQVSVRLFANSDAQVSNAWYIFHDDTSSAYTLYSLYQANYLNYYNNGTAPGETGASSQYFNSSVDTSANIRVISFSSTTLVIRYDVGTYRTFSDIYTKFFRFYVERLTFNNLQSVSMNFNGGSFSATLVTSAVHAQPSSHFYLEYKDLTNSNKDWPTQNVGDYIIWTITFGSITVDASNDPDQLFATMSVVYKWAHYYDNLQNPCGCKYCWTNCYFDYWDGTICPDYQCCYPYSCRIYQDINYYIVFSIANYYKPSYNLFSGGADTYLIARQANQQTQVAIWGYDITISTGPSYGSFLLLQFHQGSYSNQNPFIHTRNNDLGAQIDCKCIVGNSIVVSSTTSYLSPKCYRYKPDGMDPSVGIFVDIAQNLDFKCWLPGFNVGEYASGRINIDMFRKTDLYFHRYIPRSYWNAYATYNSQHSYTTTGTYGGDSLSQNTFWTNGVTILNSRYYQMNYSATTSFNQPYLYMSMYAPQPVGSFCQSGSFSQCRIYDSFINHKYYVIARSSTTTSQIRINGTAYLPKSKDINSNYYYTFVAMSYTDDARYYHIWSQTRANSYLLPIQTAPSYSPPIYGTNLAGNPSSLILSIDLNGRILYSRKRTYGQQQGSYIEVSISGLATLYGCGATISNRVRSLYNPLFCYKQSSTILRIISKQDLSITGTLYVMLFTDSVASSVSYSFTLFDKYVSNSDYSLTLQKSGSFSRSVGGYSAIGQPTSILFRRTVYKYLFISDGPIRIFLNNNFQYVYDYTTQSNTDAIRVTYHSTFSNTDHFICYIKQYPPGKKYLWKDYQTSCIYQSANTIRVSSIPSHILTVDYYYELIIYRNDNDINMRIAAPSSNNYLMTIQTVKSSSNDIANQDIVRVERYLQYHPVDLLDMYTLTKEAASLNSLYINFDIDLDGTNPHYLEFQFDNLGLSSFNIQNGQEIPCYLSSNFYQTPGQTIPPRCLGYTSGIDQDTPLKIRVMNFKNITLQQDYQIAFDNFNNPSLQPLFLVPMNVKITYYSSTRAVYKAYNPQIYSSDSFNRGTPGVFSASLSRSNANYGGSGHLYLSSVSWPYTSSYTISQKLVLKISGGITCCNDFSNFYLNDYTGNYGKLWTNTKLNLTVYRTPARSQGSTNVVYLYNVINPYPYQMQDYENLKLINFLFYSDYKNTFIKQFSQFDFSTYNRLTQFNAAGYFNMDTTNNNYDYHQGYPMTYNITFTSSASSYPNRQLSYTILKFTSGINKIDKVYPRFEQSPYIINPLLEVTFDKDTDGLWILNITGMGDSLYSYRWYIVMRYYPNNNYLNYTSTTYCSNQVVEFTNTISEYVYNNGYNSSVASPTTFEIFQERYFKDFYHLQRSKIYADANMRTRRLFFRFTTPYAMASTQSFSINIPSVTQLVPQTSPNDLTCIIQPTRISKTSQGIGLHTNCTYSSGLLTFGVPIGGLSVSTQYTISILERNQLTTAISLPASPKRLQLSFVYNSGVGLQYGDIYILNFVGRFSAFSISHMTLRISTYNMIGVTFTPKFTLPAASLTAPVTESVLQLEFDSRFFEKCLSIASLYSDQSMVFNSGVYYSHYSSPAVVNANTRIICGQSTTLDPAKLTITDYGQITAGSSYYFRFPLIVNPSTARMPFNYRLRLLHYASNTHYPIVIGEYEYENVEQVIDGSSAPRTTGLTLNSGTDTVQSNVVVSFYYSTWYGGTYVGYFIGSGTNVLVKFDNDEIKAFTGIDTLKTLGSNNSNYNYQYYPNINLCVFIKNNGANDNDLYIGTFPTSIQQQSFKVKWSYGYPDKSLVYTSGALSSTLSYRTSWSSSSFTKLSGGSSSNSVGTWRLSFTSPVILPFGSLIKIVIDSYLQGIDDYCKATSGFQFKANEILTCRRATTGNEYWIYGFDTIPASTSMSVDFYIKINANPSNTWSQNAVITCVDTLNSNKTIILASTNSYSLTVNTYGGSAFALANTMTKQLQENTNVNLLLSFKLTSQTLVNGDYLLLNLGNWTVDTVSTTPGKITWRYKVGSNYYWIPISAQLTPTGTSLNLWKLPVYSNYSMTNNTLITLSIIHIYPDAYQGIKIVNPTWNHFVLEAYTAAGVRIQHQYQKVWVQPYEHLSLVVDPILNYINENTPYIFSVTPNISILPGSYISVQFQTTDGLHPIIFSKDMGYTFAAGELSKQLSCREIDANHIISDTNIKCELFKGDETLNPSVPATIKIPITKYITTGTTISFSILRLKNPAVKNYPVSITIKLQSLCQNGDSHRPCTLFKSTQYLTYATTSSVPGLTNSASFSSNPPYVSSQNSIHTHSASVSLAIGDFLKITYPSNIIVPNECSVASGGICWAYPLQNIMLIKVTSTFTTSYSFAISSFTNLAQRQDQTIVTQIYNTVSGIVRARIYVYPVQTIITTDAGSGEALSITFTPTLTPNYFLKYSFDNIARIQISHILQNQQTKMIRISSASLNYINPLYCNATMETFAGQALPYPYRFKCITMNSGYIDIVKQSDFPAWDPNFKSRKIILYLKYQLNDGLLANSGNWQANAYTTTSVASQYGVSQAVGSFSILDYKHPYIYKVNLNTLSFTKRTCHIYEMCTFYGYLEPSTPQADKQISYAVFTLPTQFNYSNLQTYNKCVMQQSNSDSQTFNCYARRNNSNVMIKYQPPSTYNHHYKLISIDTSDSSKLFTAPGLPGDQYQMGVELYGTDDSIVQIMKVNVTTVYGYLLEQPKILINIPMDANAKGLFDIQFEVGNTSIPPGYQSTQSNSVVSQIQVIFANTFPYDLGTGKASGSQIGCLPVSGMTFKTMGRIKCVLHHSVSSITYPTIKITGYDKILYGTTVRFRFASLQTLPQGVSDYMKLAVSLVYYRYGRVQGYLYEPTGVVVGPTTPAISPKTITFTISESSSNIVGQLVNYTFTGNFAGSFTPISTSDYISIEFPQYFFQGWFSLNENLICPLAMNSKALSFGIAHIIYFNPTSAISSTAFSFNLNKMINSAYNHDYINKKVTIRTIIGNKVDSMGEGTLLKFSKPSPNISAIITNIGSVYGGDSGIVYSIELQSNTQLPVDAVIKITVPSIYENLLKTNVGCQILAQGNQYCKITSVDSVLIYINGEYWKPTQPYQLFLSNMTNPNTKLTNSKWKITSFFDQDTYKKRIISQSLFDSPDISVLQVKKCTFQVNLNAYNPTYNATYQLIIICPTLIKKASEMKVYLSWSPNTTVGKTCTSTTDSLYSYECNIQQEFQGTNKTTYLGAYLRQIVPQKLISISTTLPNPISGTYTLVANISYKGFTYLSSKSNKFYITSDTFAISKFSTQLSSFPLNRGEEGIFSFKFANIQDTTLDIVVIGFPSTIDFSRSPTCNYQYQVSSNEIQLLMIEKQNELDCSFSNNKLFVNGVNNMSSPIKTDSFFYISIYGIKNPNISSPGEQFEFTFLKQTTVLSKASRVLPYRISSPPITLQILNFVANTYKLLVKTNYVYSIKTVDSLVNIPAKSNIAVILAFPQQYIAVWQKMPIPSSFGLKIGAQTFTASKIQMTQGKLIASFNITSQLQLNSLELIFQFRNPAQALDCSAKTIFKIGIYNYKTNSLLAQTLANYVSCPIFSDRLYEINITGTSLIQSGSAETFTITIEQPADYLEITPVSTISSIVFQPASIVFDNYTNTQKTFMIKASSAQTGNYTITFNKNQNGSQYYNDIDKQTIQIIQPSRLYMITFEQVQLKSIGLPIQLPIILERQSSSSVYLLYQHNCSQQYVLDPPKNLLIPSGVKKTSLWIKYEGKVIPQMCAIKFALSALRKSNYQLETNIIYVSGMPSANKQGMVVPMKMSLTTAPKRSQSIGRQIVQKQSSKNKLKPVVYQLQKIGIGSNAASFIITVSQPGDIYFAVLQIGTKKNVTQQSIYNMQVPTGKSYGSSKTITNNINIQSNFTAKNLSAQTSYMMASYLNSSVGISDIEYLVFHTDKSSNGAGIKIALSSIVDNSVVLEAFSKVLRINPSRMVVSTVIQSLNTQQATHLTQVMNSRQYVYEVLVGPNVEDDTIPPIEQLNQLKDSDYLQERMKNYLTGLDKFYKISTREIILAKPKFRTNQGITLIKLTHDKVKVNIKLWQQAYVYGIILPNPVQPAPLSVQIAQGVSNINQKLLVGHNSSGKTNSKGQVQLQFNLLTDNTSYTVYITAECILPYTPRLRLSNQEVQSIGFKTSLNLNLEKNKGNIVQQLKNVDPVLAQKVRQHIASVEKKKQINGNSKIKRKRVIKL